MVPVHINRILEVWSDNNEDGESKPTHHRWAGGGWELKHDEDHEKEDVVITCTLSPTDSETLLPHEMLSVHINRILVVREGDRISKIELIRLSRNILLFLRRQAYFLFPCSHRSCVSLLWTLLVMTLTLTIASSCDLLLHSLWLRAKQHQHHQHPHPRPPFLGVIFSVILTIIIIIIIIITTWRPCKSRSSSEINSERVRCEEEGKEPYIERRLVAQYHHYPVPLP